ncbi:MAG: DoxX family protein, partial [Maribacter sp.]
FITVEMKREFKRYGLASYRKIVGLLQILGGSGLLIGLFYLPILQLLASAGLSVLMILGFLVRLKIKDSVVQALPSLSYAILNVYLFYKLLPLL